MAYDKPFELKAGNFQLFKNLKKTEATHADWTGSIKMPDGREFWFNMYNKQGPKGSYFSGYIGKEKQQVDQPAAYRSFPPVGQGQPMDDVPF